MWWRRKITIIIMVILILSLTQYFDHEKMVRGTSGTVTKDPYTISSKDYFFPKNGLEKKDNVTKLAESILDIFGMDLKDTDPEVRHDMWISAGSKNTLYTFIIGEREYFNAYQNSYQIRSHKLKMVYIGELFYYLEINFDWNLGKDLEDDAFHIIDTMELNDMDLRIERMDVDGGLKIRSEDIGLNDTNKIELYERSAYMVDDGVWDDGKEVRISAWLNISWDDYIDTQNLIENLTDDIYNNHIMNNFPLAKGKEVLWIYGAWERELTWFQIDPLNETLKLEIRPELHFMYYFRIPEDNYSFYFVHVNLSTLWSEEGRISEGSIPGSESPDCRIIHYHYDPENEKYIPLFILILLFLVCLITVIIFFVLMRRKKTCDKYEE